MEHKRRGTFRPDRHGVGAEVPPPSVRTRSAVATAPRTELEIVGQVHPDELAHLQDATRAWCWHVVDNWNLDRHHFWLLLAAAESWDTAQEARERLEAEGLTIPTVGGGCRPHPCVQIAAAARRDFASYLEQLGLEDGGPGVQKLSPTA